MTNVLFIFILGWLAAARLTRLVVVDDLLDPLHEWVEKRWRTGMEKFVQAGVDEHSKALTPERAKVLKGRHDRTYRRWKWVSKMISCYWCAGLWWFLLLTAVAAVATLDRGGWQILGGPAWFTLPTAALGAHWLYALANLWADWGAHGKLAERRQGK